MSYYSETEDKNMNLIDKYLEKFPKYVEQYIESIRFTTTAQTRLGYLYDYETFFEYVADAKQIPRNEITPEVLDTLDKHFLDKYLGYLQKYEKNGKTYKNGIPAIRRKLASLRNLFKYLYLDDKMKSCEITKVNTPKLRKKNIVKLDDDEKDALFSEIESPTGISEHQRKCLQKQELRDYTLIYLLYSTGLRVSECAGLNLADVNLEKFTLKIIRKGNKEANIYLSDNAAEYLARYIEYRKPIMAVEGHEEALFLSSQRKRLTVRSIERIVKKYASSAVPQKKITPHKMRATYATKANAETGNLLLVSSLLGHENISTTTIYTKQDEELKMKNRNIVQ